MDNLYPIYSGRRLYNKASGMCIRLNENPFAKYQKIVRKGRYKAIKGE